MLVEALDWLIPCNDMGTQLDEIVASVSVLSQATTCTIIDPRLLMLVDMATDKCLLITVYASIALHACNMRNNQLVVSSVQYIMQNPF